MTAAPTGNNEIRVGMANATSVFAFAVDPPDTLVVGHSLEMHVVDIEGTLQQAFDWGTLLANAGIRFARLEQNFAATEVGGSGAFIHSHHRFNGVGPTVALTATRNIGESGLALFATGRGAILFGDRQLHIEEDGGDISNIGGFEDFVPVLESRIGVSWTKTLRGCAQFFVQAAFEGQAWLGAGSAWSSNDVYGGLYPNDADMGLVGFALNAGFSR